MISLSFQRTTAAPLQILCLGAHSDDLEIGCGGTILKFMEEYHPVEINWVVFGAHGERADEAEASAHTLLTPAHQKQVIVKNFRDGFFPYHGESIKEEFEALKSVPSPDLIFTHYRDDLHQDHRLISELTWNTFRDHLILEYEIPKYDGDFGRPNLYSPLDEIVVQQKIRHLMAHFKSQHTRHWFTEGTFEAMMRLRGMEARSPSGFAEAYYCRKLSIGA